MRLETDPQNKTIQMRGPIGDFEGGISADDFRDCLKEHEGSDVTIHLDSEGGVVSEGLAMYNAIMQHDGEVTIHIDTIAASIATVIACAASKVVINSNAKFMVHRCWTMAMGNCKDFRSTADIMEMMDKDIAATYVERTGKDEADVIAMMDAETWMDAEEALAQGFVHEVNKIERKPRATSSLPEVKAYSPFAVSAKARATARRMKMNLK
ncbi:MAG: head maturation protease, ClpP-related [Pirellulales bacterium]